MGGGGKMIRPRGCCRRSRRPRVGSLWGTPVPADPAGCHPEVPPGLVRALSRGTASRIRIKGSWDGVGALLFLLSSSLSPGFAHGEVFSSGLQPRLGLVGSAARSTCPLLQPGVVGGGGILTQHPETGEKKPSSVGFKSR